MHENFVEAGTLEINRYVPPALLQGKDLGAMDVEEFLHMFACARYLEDVEVNIRARAISDAFGKN